jgi:hypothetical protein
VYKVLLFLLASIPSLLKAQQVIVKGVIEDDKGQRLSASHVIVFPDSTFIVANSNGQFVIRTTAGEKRLVVSYVGFETLTSTLKFQGDTV